MKKYSLGFTSILAGAITALGGSPISEDTALGRSPISEDTDVRPTRKKRKTRTPQVFVRKMNDPAFREHWQNHPGRNPRHNDVVTGNRYFERSRWIPHSGAKEAARYANRTN